MNFNFELILFYAVVVTGLIYLLDVVFFAPRRKKQNKENMPIIIDYSRAFFPVLIIVFLLRSFLYEPFRIPSGSLEPTLLMGDFIAVNKFDYGVRLPVVHMKLFGDGEPQRGDIIVFRWPPNPSFNFIKRVIGVPGDHISYVNKELYVNGEKAPQTYIQTDNPKDESGETWRAIENQENLLGIKHDIYLDQTNQARDFHDVIVPPGHFFVMGDNRDKSADSRYWGFVPDKNIVGKAVLVWMSWNGDKTRVRFNRIGTVIR